MPMLPTRAALRVLLAASAGLALLTIGCRSGDDRTSGEERAGSNGRASTLPDHVELSKTEGVSIVQCPLGSSCDSLARQGGSQRMKSLVVGDGDSQSAEAKTATLREIIIAWCSFDGWIVIDADLPGNYYNMKVDAAQRQGGVWSVVKPALEDVFGLRFVEGVQPTDAVVIQKGQEGPAGLTRVEADGNNGRTARTPGGFGYDFQAASMKLLAETVAEYVDGPVLDETGLEGYYKFVLSMDHWKPETVFPAVERLGLKLVKVKRDLPIMRVIDAGAGVP